MPKNSRYRRFGAFVGSGPAMKRLYDTVSRAAKVDLPVLIVGETGTGKELVAQEIHARSSRKKGPFIPVNMGAVSRELVASELFGHVKGAFTGATEKKPGCFEEADNGILFLDEITTMDEDIQVTLLRVLETKQYRPVGSARGCASNARVIAATNEDLRTAVEAGTFREDLMHRLQVLQIVLPALRDNRGDIPMLAEHFLDEFAKEYGLPVGGLSPETLRILQAYDWPGNNRELRNVIAQAAVNAESTPIQPEHLPERITQTSATATGSHSAPPDPEETSSAFDTDKPGHNGVSLPLVIPLEDVERTYITHALQHCSNNKTETAKRLGISRKALYDKLNRWGLS
ncbi:MAG: hypothetical protein AMXMBFR82_12770 [Candidatus Hydrogenedentota bacterium]